MTTTAPADPSGPGREPRRRDQSETPYLDALASHRDAVAGCFNVPAHKAGRYAPPKLAAVLGEQALALDIPPMIGGIDVGPRPTALARARSLAADAWGAGHTWFVDHGGSGAVHAALLSARQLGPSILMQRNVHASAIVGLILAGLRPAFVHPEVDGELGVAHCVSRERLTDALTASPDVAAVFLLSPTYYGSAADVRGLIEEAHAAGKPVIVDEAWGAHFAFSASLPVSAADAGADLVISSTHKMAGSLTQSAMLHLGRSPVGFDSGMVDRAVTALESTSRSALLAASLDAARSWMATAGERAIAETLDAVPDIHQTIRDQLGLAVLDRQAIGSYAIHDVDPLRLCVDTRPRGLDARRLGAGLCARGVFPELLGRNVVVATLAPGEDRERISVFVRALADALRSHPATGAPAPRGLPLPIPGPMLRTPRDAWLGQREQVPIRDAVGRICADTLAVYPPGIPNVIPGEAITAELVSFVAESLAAGAVVRGNPDPTHATVSVVAE